MSETFFRYNDESVFPKEELKQHIDLHLSEGQARELLEVIKKSGIYRDDSADYRTVLRARALLLTQEEALAAIEYINRLKREANKLSDYV